MTASKTRTRLGVWIDAKGMKQSWLARKVGMNRHTVASMCNNPEYRPTLTTIQKVMKALKEIDPGVNGTKFWDL